MASTQVVETSIAKNSLFQDSNHPFLAFFYQQIIVLPTLLVSNFSLKMFIMKPKGFGLILAAF